MYRHQGKRILPLDLNIKRIKDNNNKLEENYNSLGPWAKL